MAKDIAVQEDYILSPHENLQEKIFEISPLEISEKYKVFALSLAGTVFLIGSIVWIWDGEPSIFGFLIFLLIAITCFSGAFYEHRAFLLGSLFIDVDERHIPNHHLQVTLKIRPKGKIMLENINVRLVLLEEVDSGSGSSRQTHHKEYEVDSQYIDVYRQLPAHQTTSFSSVNIKLPEILIPTFELEDNQLKWQLKYDIKTDKQTTIFATDIFVAMV
ncbi:hypothetical protein [Psychrobacter sp. I-STPA6b]|uniref:hypothetical protein n=1 Tax=Psychrobacter sp. I-STPA6b TaxID=2585718 RepID=UPI001D0CAE83|nr:hypothetical protein [Psychrobacter sp. I-STPA6b]